MAARMMILFRRTNHVDLERAVGAAAAATNHRHHHQPSPLFVLRNPIHPSDDCGATGGGGKRWIPMLGASVLIVDGELWRGHY